MSFHAKDGRIGIWSRRYRARINCYQFFFFITEFQTLPISGGAVIYYRVLETLRRRSENEEPYIGN